MGVSGGSGGRRESQESDAGVRGLGLQGLGLLLRRVWPQELIQTRASAASRSVYSRPPGADAPQVGRSLSYLLLFRKDPLWSIRSTPNDSSISVNVRDGII